MLPDDVTIPGISIGDASFAVLSVAFPAPSQFSMYFVPDGADAQELLLAVGMKNAVLLNARFVTCAGEYVLPDFWQMVVVLDVPLPETTLPGLWTVTFDGHVPPFKHVMYAATFGGLIVGTTLSSSSV